MFSKARASLKRGEAQNNQWHKDIDRLAKSSNPADDYFPLRQLGNVTKKLVSYLQKGSEAWEEELVKLVKQHPRKDFAILSCASVLPSETIRKLIQSELQRNLMNKNAVIYYLDLVVAFYEANPQAIHEYEKDCAHSLVQLSNPVISTIGIHLKVLASRQAAGVSTELVFCDPIKDIPRNLCQSLATKLTDLRNHNQWILAQEISSWLPQIRGASLTLEEQLNDIFPAWHSWAAWQPENRRLKLWQDINEDSRKELRDILSLEGPDINGAKATIREALTPILDEDIGYILHHGKIRIVLDQIDAHSDIHRVSNHIVTALDDVCMGFPTGLPMLSSICSGHIVSRARVDMLRRVIATRDASVASGVMALLDAEAHGIQINTAIKLVIALREPRFIELREALAGEITEIVEVEMSRMEIRLRAQVERREPATGIITKIHTLGTDLQRSSWILQFLNTGLRERLQNWPTTQYIDALLKLRADAQKSKSNGTTLLVKSIDMHCMIRLIGYGELPLDVDQNIKGLVSFWQRKKDANLQTAALTIAQQTTIPADISKDCVADLCNLPHEFVSRIAMIVKSENDIGCVSLAGLLLSRTGKDHNGRYYGGSCWRELLYWMTERRDTLLDHLLLEKSVEIWFRFVENFRLLFTDRPQSATTPHILQEEFQSWNRRLSLEYLGVLKACETSFGYGVIIKWILTRWEDEDTIIPFLNVLKAPKQEHRFIIKELLKKFSLDGSNKEKVVETIMLISMTSELGCRVCMNIHSAQQVWGKRAAEGLYECSIEDPELTTRDIRALESFGQLMDLEVRGNIDDEERILNMHAASGYLNEQYEVIMNEARRLESIRLTLKADDPRRTSSLLARIGAEDPSAVEDRVANVTPDLIDVVEKIGPAEFEMVFPLTQMKSLQRRALGIGEARILLIRLRLVDEGFQFCMHLFPSDIKRAHRFFEGVEAPQKQVCFGKTNRLTYQLGRELFRVSRRFESLETTYTFLKEAIQTLNSRCVVCGKDIGVTLHRSTTCGETCRLTFLRATIEVRLAENWVDSPVLDLLLSSVHAASLAAPANQLLLPGCPNPESNIGLIDQMPDLTTLGRNLSKPLEALLSWICTSHRGYLASVTDALRIPSMPGALQFVLASSSPEKEKAFAAHVSGPNLSRVVFHGTSLDRLYGILHSGLVVASGGPLQRNGASYGQGIYTAEEPRTAWAYTSAPGAGWRSSRLGGMRLMLGCELDINVPAAGVGIYVISDESQLIVRYVFLYPSDAALHEIPVAIHVAPAMSIAFNLLRSGVV